MKNGRMLIGFNISCFVSAKNSAFVKKANVINNMWPASMLAKSRTARENGRRMMLDKNSIAPTRGRMATGTPFGHTIAVMYLMPLCLKPTAL